MSEHAELLSSVRDDISEYKVSLTKSSSLFHNYSYNFSLLCFCCYCYYFLCFVVSQHQVCVTCFHAGIWEHVPKDAIIAGESSHPWKYSSCKLKCYSLVILHVVHIFLSIKKKSYYMLYALQRSFHFCICYNIFSILCDAKNEMLRFFSGTTHE